MNAHSLSPPPRRREREKQERRSAILSAAERLIITKGFADASVDSIAREADVAAGTVYLYFSGKEALVQELLGSKVRLLNDTVAAEMKIERPFETALQAIVQAMFRHFEEQRSFFEIFVRERMEFCRSSVHTDCVLRDVEAGISQLAAWLTAAQKAGALPRGRARSLAVALRGLVFQFTRDWLRSGAHGRLTQHTAFVTGFFLKGAGA